MILNWNGWFGWKSNHEQSNHSPDRASFVNRCLASCYPTISSLSPLWKDCTVLSQKSGTLLSSLQFKLVFNSLHTMLVRKSKDEQFKAFVLPHWQYCALFGDFSTACISSLVCMCLTPLHSKITTIQTGLMATRRRRRNSFGLEHVFHTLISLHLVKDDDYYSFLT